MSFLAIKSRPKYRTIAANFDGTNDYGNLGGSPAGIIDGDKISLVVSIDFTGTGGPIIRARPGAVLDPLSIALEGGGNIGISCSNSGGAQITSMLSTTTYSSSDGWKLFLFSKSGTTLHLYDGDTDIKDAPITNIAGDIDLTTTDWYVGGFNLAGNRLAANFADLWFNNSYIDFSMEANRRKFVDVRGKPVWKGLDGSLPTGTAPLIFLRRNVGESADSFLTNKGTGGGFTVNGALSDSTNGNPTG